MKVFIVEDASQTRKDIAEALAAVKEFEIVGQAESVRDAKRGFHATSPETVILDISLPDGSGVEILKMVRNQRMGICVVVLTFDPSCELQKKCMELGAAAVFDKLNGFKKAFEFLRLQLPAADVRIGEAGLSCG